MPTGDFWFFAGIAVMCLGIGQCTRMERQYLFSKSPESATAELIEACAMRVRLGYDVPAVCKPDEAMAKADRE